MSLLPNGKRSLLKNNRRILFAILAVTIAIGLGTIGFYLIEGWSILDSLYVAAQTVTTVGYGDLTPATRNGRIFSTVFMLVAVDVVLTARDLNKRMHIVARAAEEQAEPKLIRAGANRVVAPTIIGGHRMAMALTKPAVDDFLG